MARKVVVELVDDYDGESIAVETVVFAIDGATYEINLSGENAGLLRGIFGEWTPHARRVGRIPKSKNASRAPERDDTAAIREWARTNGFSVSHRGRLQAEIVEAYEKAKS